MSRSIQATDGPNAGLQSVSLFEEKSLHLSMFKVTNVMGGGFFLTLMSLVCEVSSTTILTSLDSGGVMGDYLSLAVRDNTDTVCLYSIISRT